MSFTAVELIEKKRDGEALSAEAIEWLIAAYTSNHVTDYQMSAMTMAIFFNGLDDAELSAWTRAMLFSGDVLDFSEIRSPKVDKHSTGGVGDKISIPLAPLVASCGIAVPMISGRSLGHTGGTLDKLETIPGFTTDLNRVAFRSLLESHGLVLAGQSDTLAPADKKLYSLRDATGTVPSIPLIASSIMSKKLAEGLDGLVLDVKTGSGAQMKALADSRHLAETMVGIGNAHGMRTVALITDMSQPLGKEVGNANEIKESIDVLRGEGPADVTELTMAFGEVMLELAGVEGGRGLLESRIESGHALDKFREVVIAQEGDPAVIDDPTLLPQGRYEASIRSSEAGYVQECDALRIGTVITRLGAGRESMGDTIDPGVGLTVHKKIGDRVAAGDSLTTVVYNDSVLWGEQREALLAAWVVGDERVSPPKLIIERIES